MQQDLSEAEPTLLTRNQELLHEAFRKGPVEKQEDPYALDQRFWLGVAKACGLAFFLGMLLLVLPLALIAGGAK
jgi:DNA-binding GntR family transcriptional regulator